MARATMAQIDFQNEFALFQDHLATGLDTYEQAIYLYLFRHTTLKGQSEITVGFKSARKKMAFGVGEKGKPMAEGTCYEKLRSLQTKGFLKIVGAERSGTRITVHPPSVVFGQTGLPAEAVPLDIEDLDFFEISENRQAILERENSKCFYCLAQLNASNYVIEHVVSRPQGSNSYRNLVSACLICNNRKGHRSAEEHLRTLFREGFLGESDFAARIKALTSLRNGELKPRSQ
jgi:hypothetical protein